MSNLQKRRTMKYCPFSGNLPIYDDDVKAWRCGDKDCIIEKLNMTKNQWEDRHGELLSHRVTITRKYYSITQAANYLGVFPLTLRNWMKKELIKGFRTLLWLTCSECWI